MLRKAVLGAGILGLSLSLLAGCSSSGNSSSESLGATEAATATASEANAIATSMTQSQVIASSGAMVAKASGAKADGIISSCASIDVTGSGPDGWTAETLTFTVPPCSFTGVRGYGTLDVTGQIDLTRSSGDEFSFTAQPMNMDWVFTTGSTTYSELRNGTRNITASPTGASATSNMTVVLDGARHDGTLTHQLAANFTPASGSTLQGGEPLPNGNLTITGTGNWVGVDGNTATFSATTLTPLAYDASCTATEPSVFSSGELQLEKTNGKGTTTVTITWTNCGSPVITVTN
jgi:carbon monoxide dehydrogenase subunit G